MSAESSISNSQIHDYEQIAQRVRLSESGRKPKAALILPCDDDMLKMFVEAVTAGLIDPVILGDQQLVGKQISALGAPFEDVRHVDVKDIETTYRAAVKMAVSGKLDLLVCGTVTPVDLLRILLDKGAGFVGGENTLSHVAAMKPDLYAKLLFVTDAAVNMEPDLRCKLALTTNAVNVARRLGIRKPRVALIAAVEKVHPHMPATVDAAVIARMGDRGQIQNALVDGPLSFDVAVDPEAARAKGITDSLVAGQADILIAPNIETANGIYRAMSLYGRADVGGVIYGGKIPVVYNACSEPQANKLNSIVLGAALAVR